MGLISRVSSRTYRHDFHIKTSRAMINMMNKSQRRNFTLSLYKNILKDANKLKYTNKEWIVNRVRWHLEENLSIEPGSIEQTKAIERLAYFHQSNLGGLL